MYPKYSKISPYPPYQPRPDTARGFQLRRDKVRNVYAACSYLAQHAELCGRQPRHGLLQLGSHRHVRLGDEEQAAAGKCELRVGDEALFGRCGQYEHDGIVLTQSPQHPQYASPHTAPLSSPSPLPAHLPSTGWAMALITTSCQQSRSSLICTAAADRFPTPDGSTINVFTPNRWSGRWAPEVSTLGMSTLCGATRPASGRLPPAQTAARMCACVSLTNLVVSNEGCVVWLSDMKSAGAVAQAQKLYVHTCRLHIWR